MLCKIHVKFVNCSITADGCKNSSGNGRRQLARDAAKKQDHSSKRPRQQHRIRRPTDRLQERGVLKRMYVTDFVHALQHTRILSTVAPHVR